jgi:hypothetical protein
MSKKVRLDCHLYNKLITYMHQIFSNGFLKLKNMNQIFICVFSYMHFFVWFLFGIFYKDSMYDLLKE